MTDPIQFFREQLPDLFNRGVAQMKERADDGSEKAKARHADTTAAHGLTHIVLDGEGGGEVWLTVSEGRMEAVDGAPEGLPPRVAIGAPAEAARVALEELESADLLAHENAPYRVARSASAEVEQVLGSNSIRFHLTLADLPTDPDEVTLKIGLGVVDPPDDPTFSARVSWDDIEDMRAGDLTPQQLFGRLKITGDASQAMALGMTLMQRRSR